MPEALPAPRRAPTLPAPAPAPVRNDDRDDNAPPDLDEEDNEWRWLLLASWYWMRKQRRRVSRALEAHGRAFQYVAPIASALLVVVAVVLLYQIIP